MKRFALVSAAVVLVVAVAVGLAACQKKVEVETGTRVACTYGHEVSNDVRTIEVPADEASNYRVKSERVVCDRHKKIESLYGDAQRALATGDTKTAKTKLLEVIAAEKGFGKAQAQVAEIDAGKTPTPDGQPAKPGTGSTPKPENPGEGDTSVPSGSLKVWMPDTLAGFTAQKPAVDVLSISRAYVPDGGSKAFTFVIVAEQFRSAKDAGVALDRRIKSRYTKDVDTLKINGHTVYFGTDGTRFAAAGFTDGSIAIGMEMSAREGTSPKALKGLMEDVLKQLP